MLAIRQDALGPQHCAVATSLNGLAILYRDQGKYGDAEPLFKRALAIRENVLGPQHPDVADSLENYASLLQKTDRVTEANEMETRAKSIRGMQKEHD